MKNQIYFLNGLIMHLKQETKAKNTQKHRTIK